MGLAVGVTQTFIMGIFTKHSEGHATVQKCTFVGKQGEPFEHFIA